MNVSQSPFGDTYEYTLDAKRDRRALERFANRHRDAGRSIAVVQGLGFVGTAMVAALTESRDSDSSPRYGVIGVDLPGEQNYWKIGRTNDGKPARVSDDPELADAYRRASEAGNLHATYLDEAYRYADIVVVDIPLDADKPEPGRIRDYDFSYESFKKALEPVAERISEQTLVVIETTVPPGTTEQIVYPIFRRAFEKRGLETSPQLAHSYERVMPGGNYLESVTDYYRVYAGIDRRTADKTARFLESFINTDDYPLTELDSPTASEMAKVLENSYRATNIAFIQEWTEFADLAGVDLFEVIEAIRQRPTHKNIRWPGFGVGGYCLPKDPLLADFAYSELFGGSGRLEMSTEAVRINDFMPLFTWQLLDDNVDLTDRQISIFGVSYLGNTADTRSSPTGIFYDKCVERGLDVQLFDEAVSYWPEKDVEVTQPIERAKAVSHDIVVFAVRHSAYLELDSDRFERLFPEANVIVDANDILSDKLARQLSRSTKQVLGVGKGHWHQF